MCTRVIERRVCKKDRRGKDKKKKDSYDRRKIFMACVSSGWCVPLRPLSCGNFSYPGQLSYSISMIRTIRWDE